MCCKHKLNCFPVHFFTLSFVSGTICVCLCLYAFVFVFARSDAVTMDVYFYFFTLSFTPVDTEQILHFASIRVLPNPFGEATPTLIVESCASDWCAGLCDVSVCTQFVFPSIFNCRLLCFAVQHFFFGLF